MRWSRIWPAVVVGGLAWPVYFLTLAPTISWCHGGADSGELAAAVATWGIPHPPGYPTYMLIGRIWAALPLGGDVAYRLNLLSAMGAALAAGLGSVAILQLSGPEERPTRLIRTGGAIFGGLLLAFAPLTWSQAIIAEVYAPGLAWLSLVTLLLFWGDQQQARLWLLWLSGLLIGAGLGLLPQLILILPGILYINIKRGYTIKKWLPLFLAGMGLGLSVFLYLPWRAMSHPLINWGNPSSPARFWAMVTARSYHQYFGLLGAVDWLNRLGASIGQLGQQLSWTGLGLALIGGYTLRQSRRAELGYLAGLIGLTVLFRTGYPVAGNIVYLLPALYGLALLSGVGAAWLLGLARNHLGNAGGGLLGLVLLISLGLRAMLIAPQLDLGGDYSAALFAQRVLADLPPDAVVISDRDQTTFSLWYYQVLGMRPDVVIVDERLVQYEWYRHNLPAHYPKLEAVDLTSGEFKRPVYMLTNLPDQETICPINKEREVLR